MDAITTTAIITNNNCVRPIIIIVNGGQAHLISCISIVNRAEITAPICNSYLHIRVTLNKKKTTPLSSPEKDISYNEDDSRADSTVITLGITANLQRRIITGIKKTSGEYRNWGTQKMRTRKNIEMTLATYKSKLQWHLTLLSNPADKVRNMMKVITSADDDDGAW